jgi:hypothetical protein
VNQLTRAHRRHVRMAVLIVALAVAACGGGDETVLQLETLSDSGVTGTVTMTEAGEQRTLVVVDVDPSGHANMPAHIHPGSCVDLVPQPRYPLQNVVDGMSTTEVPASLDELLSGDVALNLHRSNEEMQVYTACVDLRQPT